jgi:putative Holliday junction resolvase
MTGQAIMAIDHGVVRLGISISDPLRIIARPYKIIKRRSRQEDFSVIQSIIENENVSKVVIGLPTDSTGNIGTQALKTIRWAVKLSEVISLPIVFWDESFSSIDAASVRSQTSKKRTPIDDVAAAVILQEYLECGETENEPGQPLEALKQHL